MNIFSKYILWILSFFILTNFFLYIFIFLFHIAIPFNSTIYISGAHHYVTDPRVHKGKFDFLRSLGAFDAQWYLRITDKGYPKHPKIIDISQVKFMDGLNYAFFPLYSSLVSLPNHLIHNSELSAFSIGNLFLIINFFSLYYVVTKYYSSNIAIKTIFLLFLYPFSIFYRSYFTEGLYLFLLLWFSYALFKQKWFLSAICLGFLNITKGNGFLINVFFLYLLWKCVFQYKISWAKAGIITLTIFLPFLCWIVFCYIQTGNPLYFYIVRSQWFNQGVFNIFYNTYLVTQFFSLPWHNFLYSKIDVLSVVIAGFLLYKSKKTLYPVLWWIALCLWLTPLLSTSLMSFSRYQSVSFPLYIYLAQILKGKRFYVVSGIFFAFLLWVSLLFVNWYWIG